MNSRKLILFTAMTLFAAPAIPIQLGALDNPNNKHRRHDHYKFIDIGTLGGPNSYFSAGGTGNLVLNNRGTGAGFGDTSAPDPYAPNCFDADCLLAHVFRWQNGALTDLGALPGINSSAVSGINERGWIAGLSENGVVDPLLGGTPETGAALWKDSQIIDLGTLGGNESVAIAVNNRGQVIGFATNATPDPFSGFGTQIRAFVWKNGVMKDLGTLGGPDSPPLGNTIINEQGQIAGSSNSASTPNPLTGIPTTDPFLWENGTITDPGTLGGTLGFPIFMNNRCEVVGQSNLAGDITAHPFLCHRGKMMDLGTLGGTFGVANWINDAGEAVGGATTPGDQLFHAFVWRDGVMKDLGTVGDDGCSEALEVSAKDQILGQSFSCDGSTARAFIWENGSMIDLNTLIPPDSSLHLVFAGNINDRGEIVGVGVPPGDPPNPDLFGRLFLLIPCDENHEDIECENGGESTAATIRNSHPPVKQTSTEASHGTLTPETLAALRARMARRYHIAGLGAPRY